MKPEKILLLPGLLFCFGAFAAQLTAQSVALLKPRMDLFNLANNTLREKGYQAAVDSIFANEAFFLSDSADAMQKSGFRQAAMTYLSFAGRNAGAIEQEALAFPQRNTGTHQLENHAKAVLAETFIPERFGNAPIIMINEAHSRGQNRAFVRSLLPALYQRGFRCLAVETLDYKDTLVNQRKYPLQTSGYYSREPAFGQLLREASAMGFELLAYEDTTAQLVTDNYMDNLNKREQVQAENIFAYHQKHPGRKILVLAGHGHIEKMSKDEWKKMGERLCALMREDLPSIECTAMKEGFDLNHENKIYRAVADSFRFKKPVVLLINDTVFVTTRHQGKVDVNVFLPRTDYSSGYPDWLRQTAEKTATLTLPEQQQLSGHLLQIYQAEEWKKEGKNAVPVLNAPIQKEKQSFDLYLPSGEYKILIIKDYEHFMLEQTLNIK
jgi:hypothetical protein